jgi:hypothetical protein
MLQVTLYKPEGRFLYNAVAKVRVETGVLEFETAEGCLLTQTPPTGREFNVKFEKKKVKTNLPFFVEDED